MKRNQYLYVRYYKHIEQASSEDIIVKYFYSENEKKWIFENSWDYASMLKRIKIVGALNFIDEFYDFIQNGRFFADIRFMNEPLEEYKKGSDFKSY